MATEAEDAAPLATASAALASSASSSVTVQSLREQLARQSYAFVCAHDMWHMLGVAADTAPSLLALWASMVKVALLVAAHAATCRPRSPPLAQRERETERGEPTAALRCLPRATSRRVGLSSRWDEAVPQIDEAGREVYPFKGTLVTYYELDAAACDGPRRAPGHGKMVCCPRPRPLPSPDSLSLDLSSWRSLN